MKWLILIVIGLLLGGCATTKIQPSVHPQVALSNWHERQRSLDKIDRFSLHARIAASGSFGVSGDLLWRQKGNDFHMHFSGPFGAGAVSIAGTPQHVVIRSGNNRQTTRNPQAYLRQHYGWALPVSGLRYWVLGLPVPGSPAGIRYGSNGRLSELFQDGWTIHYEDYRRTSGYALPRHMRMDAAGTHIRIVVDNWSQIRPASSRQ